MNRVGIKCQQRISYRKSGNIDDTELFWNMYFAVLRCAVISLYIPLHSSCVLHSYSIQTKRICVHPVLYMYKIFMCVYVADSVCKQRERENLKWNIYVVDFVQNMGENFIFI